MCRLCYYITFTLYILIVMLVFKIFFLKDPVFISYSIQKDISLRLHFFLKVLPILILRNLHFSYFIISYLRLRCSLFVPGG